MRGKVYTEYVELGPTAYLCFTLDEKSEEDKRMHEGGDVNNMQGKPFFDGTRVGFCQAVYRRSHIEKATSKLREHETILRMRKECGFKALSE